MSATKTRAFVLKTAKECTPAEIALRPVRIPQPVTQLAVQRDEVDQVLQVVVRLPHGGGQLLEQGGADVEGHYVPLTFLPFDETKHNRMLASFVKYTGKDKVTGLGASAWAASGT